MVSLKQYISDLGAIVWHKKLDGSDPLRIDNSMYNVFTLKTLDKKMQKIVCFGKNVTFLAIKIVLFRVF